MFLPIHSRAGYLADAASSASNVLQLSDDLYSALESVLGEFGANHTYLAVQGPVYEVVRVNQLIGTCQATVTRGIDGTAASAIAAGTVIVPSIPAAAVQDMIDASLPSDAFTLAGTYPITVTEGANHDYTIALTALQLTSPDATVDITGTWPSLGLAVNRSALGYCD